MSGKKGIFKEHHSGILLLIATIILFYGIDLLEKYSFYWWLSFSLIMLIFLLNILSVYDPVEKFKNKTLWKWRLYFFGEPKNKN